jgi:hypothetical protein
LKSKDLIHESWFITSMSQNFNKWVQPHSASISYFKAGMFLHANIITCHLGLLYVKSAEYRKSRLMASTDFILAIHPPEFTSPWRLSQVLKARKPQCAILQPAIALPHDPSYFYSSANCLQLFWIRAYRVWVETPSFIRHRAVRHPWTVYDPLARFHLEHLRVISWLQVYWTALTGTVH